MNMIIEIILRSFIIFLYLLQITICIIWNGYFAKYKYYKSVIAMSVCICIMTICLLGSIIVLLNTCGVIIGV